MAIIEWELGINKVITKNASFSIGQNALYSEKAENGVEYSALKSSSVPDTISVEMYFSNSRNTPYFHKYNRTEWEGFLIWFKHKLFYGSNAFYFPKIGDVTGEKTGIYKILSNGAPTGTPFGEEVQVKMTWQEYINESLTIPNEKAVGDRISADNGVIDYRFTAQPIDLNGNFIIPDKLDFTIEYSINSKTWKGVPITEMMFDGYRTCTLYFPTIPLPSQTSVCELRVKYDGAYIYDNFILEGKS